MPRVKPGPYKWAIFHTWTPLRWGPERWINFQTFIGGWWGLDAWCDREYCALFDTKEEAEKYANWIRRHDDFKDCVFTAPTLRRFGTEKVPSFERVKRAKARAERRRFDEFVKAERARLEAAYRKDWAT